MLLGLPHAAQPLLAVRALPPDPDFLVFQTNVIGETAKSVGLRVEANVERSSASAGSLPSVVERLRDSRAFLRDATVCSPP